MIALGAALGLALACLAAWLLAYPDALRRHRAVLAVAIVILCAPPLLILLLRQQVAVEPFAARDLPASHSVIASLLRGERLVPPPPPPPDVFTEPGARRRAPWIADADRRWEQVDPELRQRVLAIHRVMAVRHGVRMVLVEGYRSPERQDELRREGRATRAGAWQSCHQYGLAVDSAPMRGGRLQWDMEDPWTRRAYHLYGELAREAGLAWGGDWRMRDYVHVEMDAACREAKAARRRGR